MSVADDIETTDLLAQAIPPYNTGDKPCGACVILSKNELEALRTALGSQIGYIKSVRKWFVGSTCTKEYSEESDEGKVLTKITQGHMKDDGDY